MDKYRNRGQGTLTAILSLVGLFLVIDVVIALLLIFKVELPSLGSDNTPSRVTITATPTLTDDFLETDNSE